MNWGNRWIMVLRLFEDIAQKSQPPSRDSEVNCRNYHKAM